VSILPHQEGLSYINNVSPDLSYAYNQMTGQKGHQLELDKEYKANVMVAGDFKTQIWSFQFKPQNNQIVFTNPVEII
jgi:hypothetical protein